ncbi:MAG: type II secretion system F family protein, partial [Burkholderiales bacterium]
MATAVAAAKGPKEFTFSWEGKDKAGKTIRGEVRAVSVAAVNATLRRQGIMVQKVKAVKRRRGGKVTEKDIALFTRQLATMMKAGVPLLQSFEIVSKGAANPAVGKLLLDIKTDVETGSSLAAAFRKFPLHFDNLYCNLVGAGEAAGILETLLDRLATYQEKTLAIKSKIKSALFYPIAIIAVAFIITAVIMIFVIPAFKEVFTNFGADLPAPTLIVMGISDWFVAYWYIIFPVIGGSIYGFLEAWKRSVAVQIFMDKLMLKAPVFGHLVKISTIARWTRTLSTMFAAGVPLVEALDSVGGAAGNYVYAQATKQIKQEVSTGTSLTISMQNSGVFPAMVVQMCSIGEET